MKHTIRSTVRLIGQILGIALIAWAVSFRAHAQLPTFSTGHLVTAAEFNAISTAVNAINSVPSGTIAYFNNASCPTGWGEFSGARGLYIVGRVSGGTLNTAVGTALTNQEDRTHTHSLPGLTVPGLAYDTTTDDQGAHTHTYSGTTGGDSSAASSPSGAGFSFSLGGHTHNFSGTTSSDGTHHHRAAGTTSGGTTSTGTSGTQSVTIAPYMQLLICQKS